MSEEQLAGFWDAIQSDQDLQQKLQGVTDLETLASVAQQAGFDISASELKSAQESLTDVELSDCELQGVVGGLFCCSGGHRIFRGRGKMDFCCSGEHRTKGVKGRRKL